MTLAGLSITHNVGPHGGTYVAQLEGESAVGKLEWEPRGENIRVAMHTIVPPAIGGRGVARELVDRMVEDAQKLGFRIVPQCSYAAARFDQNPDWNDLRA